MHSRVPSLVKSLIRSENLGPVILAIGVGLVGGLGAIVFRYLIDGADWLFFSGGGDVLSFLGGAYVIVLPALGLVLVSFVVRRWAPEAQGHGVPEVMYAVKKEGGRIRPRVAVLKALASAVCIGSGGSVGREGPIVQIGCSFGSSLGQMLGLRERRIRLLVACGAAAGVGGTFNAPIAGVLFALEVILGRFEARSFGLVVIASVAATAVCQAVLGTSPAFELEKVFHLESYFELPIYLVLGLLAGVVGLAFVRALYFLEGAFEDWKWHPGVKAAIGGLVVGVLGYLSIRLLSGRYLFGVGYDGIEAALALGKPTSLDWSLGSEMTIAALLILILMKIVATSMTLAAGGSGGVFAPSIFLGAMLGGAFGLLVNALLPGMTAPAGAYALVGMGAVFAGTAHAPITAILILFEMTDDYQIILPLMSAVVISHLVASYLSHDSIYTIKLRRLGGYEGARDQTSVLDLILVADAMSGDHETVVPSESVSELARRFHSSHTRGLAVLDEHEKLVGIVTEYDVETALMAGDVTGKTAEDIMTRSLVTCTPKQTLRDVLQMITDRDMGQIPVVAGDDPQRLLGVLRRKELFWAYGQLVAEHRKLMLSAELDLSADHGDAVLVEMEVGRRHDRLCFRKVRDIEVPEQSLIVVLRRANHAVVPRGKTVVEPGDVVVLLTTRSGEERLRRWVSEMTK